MSPANPSDASNIEEVLKAEGVPPSLAKDWAAFVGMLDEHFGSKRAADVCKAMCGHFMRFPLIQIEHRPIGCTAVIGDPDYLSNCLPEKSPVVPPHGISALDSLDALIPYYDAHDEREFAFCFGYDGRLDSIRRLYNADAGRGPRLLGWLTESRDVDAFHAARSQRSFRVYSNGAVDIVATSLERTGQWHFQDLPEAQLGSLSRETGIDSKLIWQVIELALEMTYHGHGALMLLGEAEGNLPREDSKFRISRVPVRVLSTQQFVDIAKQDGAVLISAQGDLVDASFMLRPSAAKVPEHFAGRGRHATAYLISVSQPRMIVIAVSENKSITIFHKGEVRAIPG